jgi:lysophospholipase L1-like esterase
MPPTRPPAFRRQTALLIGAVLLAGGLVAHGYRAGSGALFYGGLLGMATALGPAAFALGRGRWRDGVLIAGISASICILLFIAGELAWRAIPGTRAEAAGRRILGRIYTPDAARANPKGFVEFWDRHLEQMKQVPWVMADPRGRNPYVLRPGARGALHDSEVRINQLGFRGHEISVEKGDRFRIVALGESTTFGVTVEPGDRPWPEVLGDRIRQELACDAPVEVINAGVAGWTLANQLSRMESDILPLRPDLILSYHGYNGFPWFFGNLPGLPFLPVPRVPPRPSKLLERVEKSWRLRDLRERYARELDPSALHADVLATTYADEYRSLIELAGSNGALLVLASFNMAVNERSPQDVVEFYAASFPDVRSAIIANQLHTQLLRQLAKPPGVRFIDTAPGVDGEYRYLFLDLIHFTQAGRERLAGRLLAGIREILIAHPRLRCRPVRR